MADAPRKLSPEDQKALEAAQATILRLQGPPPPPDPAATPMVLKRWKIRLEGVTVQMVKGKPVDRDCTTRGLIQDGKGKDGRPISREVTMDRSVVEAYNEADAWDKFRRAWGIRASDHQPTIVEVRDLEEGVLVGVPPPKVYPIHALPINATPAALEKWSQKTGLPIPEEVMG